MRNKQIGKKIRNNSSRHKKVVKRELNMAEQNMITYGIAIISLIFGMHFIFQLSYCNLYRLFYTIIDHDVFYVCCGIIGIIMGIIALIRIKSNNTLILAKSMAVSGIITCILLLIEIPLFPYINYKRQLNSCINNQRKLAEIIIMYSQDHGGEFPSDKKIWEYCQNKEVDLTCYTAGKSYNNAFGYNQELSKRKIDTISDITTFVMTADSANKSNLLTGLNDVTFRHHNQAVVSYIDGHVGTVSPETLKSLDQ